MCLDPRNLTSAVHFPSRTEDDSPYPEVRSAVANFDDPSMPVNTLRAWVLGLFWAIIIPGVNEFYYFRYPSIMVTGVGRFCLYDAHRHQCAPLDRSTTCQLSDGSRVGTMGARRQGLRRVSQPRTFHHQRTCESAAAMIVEA